jgi:hypothetical protein
MHHRSPRSCSLSFRKQTGIPAKSPPAIQNCPLYLLPYLLLRLLLRCF